MQNTRVRNLFSTILGAGVVAGGLVLSSCEDEFTEQDAIKAQQETLAALEDQEAKNAAAQEAMYDSLNRIGAKINYTVTVAAAGQGSTTNGRTSATASAEGATVTLVQGGKTYTETAGKGGVATFVGLSQGQATVTVEATDHTPVTYTTTLGSKSDEENNVGTLIPVFPLTVEAGATIVSGKAWAELDATNDAPEAAKGAMVRATVFASEAIKPYKTTNTYGKIETVTYDGLVQEATVGEDGTYSLIIPNANGDTGEGIKSTVKFMPFVAKQKYVAMEDGKVMSMEKDVLFGDGSSTHIKAGLPSIYAEVEAPAGKAEGFAVRTELTKQSINITDNDIDNAGSGYEVGDMFEFTAGVDENKSVATIEVLSLGTDGAIDDIRFEGNSALFTEAPSYTYKAKSGGAAKGAGAKFDLSFTTKYNVLVDNVGSGYWTSPTVNIVRFDAQEMPVKDFTDPALEGNVVGEKDRIIATVASTAAPLITIVNPKAKKAVIDPRLITIDDEGKVERIVDSKQVYVDGNWEMIEIEEGAGYLTSPKVTFKDASGAEVSAAGIATLSGAGVNAIQITNPGSGFSKEVNDTEHEIFKNVPLQSSTETNDTFTPGTTNVGVNFNYGTGKVQ